MIALIGNGELRSLIGAEIPIDDEGEGTRLMGEELEAASVAAGAGSLTASFVEDEVGASSEVTANGNSLFNSRDQRYMLHEDYSQPQR